MLDEYKTPHSKNSRWNDDEDGREQWSVHNRHVDLPSLKDRHQCAVVENQKSVRLKKLKKDT